MVKSSIQLLLPFLKYSKNIIGDVRSVVKYRYVTNSVVCDASKGFIYKQIKPSLVGEHA